MREAQQALTEAHTEIGNIQKRVAVLERELEQKKKEHSMLRVSSRVEAAPPPNKETRRF